MKKKRIILISVVAVALVVCLALAITFIVLNVGAHRHRFGDWEIIKQPTCLEYGIERRTCKNCEVYEDHPAARLGHDFSEQNVCKRCQYEIPVTEGLYYTLSEESYAVSVGTLAGDVKEIYIPRYHEGKPVGSIAMNGFSGRAITAVHIPDGLKEIGNLAFSECEELTECSMSITATKIGNLAFNGCSSLKTIEIPPYATLGDNLFHDCAALNNVTIPQTVTQIGWGLFGGCTSLKTVSVGASISTIKSSMFEGCTALTDFTFADGITEIEANAFKDCTALSGLVVPKSLKKFGAACLQSCTSLDKITYAGTKKEWIAIQKELDWLANLDAAKDFHVYCTDGILNRWNVEISE